MGWAGLQVPNGHPSGGNSLLWEGMSLLPLGSACRGCCRGESGLDQELELPDDLQSLGSHLGWGAQRTSVTSRTPGEEVCEVLARGSPSAPEI